VLSKTILTGSLMVATLAVFSIVGCNEVDSKPAATVEIFPADCVGEEIASTEKDVTKIVRLTDSSGKLVGFRVEMRVVSKSGPFDIMIALNDKACVLDAQVLKYRARRGRQVRSKAFTRQFAGKCPGDAVELGKDIDAVSGATLSAKAMTKGVNKAIALVSKML
jgi:Na+-translocating ferredoxin:NAD+ oxidoreductase RnfG subunit